MKKLLCMIMVLLTLTNMVYAGQTFEIDTAYGIKTVVIPDGYTAEEVLCQVAKAYYELNEEHKELIIQYQELSEEVKGYIKSNEDLRTEYLYLQEQYQTLVSLQNKDSLMDNFRLYMTVDSSLNNTSLSVGTSVGIILLENFMMGGGLRINTSMWGNPQFMIQLGYIF